MFKRLIILLLALVLVAAAYFLSTYRLDWEALTTFYDRGQPGNAVSMELQETHAALRKDIDRLNAQLSKANQQINALKQQNTLQETALKQVIAFHDEDVRAINQSQQQTFAVTEQLEQLKQELGQTQNQYVTTAQLNETVAKALATNATFRPVNLDLGPLPVGEAKQLAYPIPDSIPETAREILIYVHVATNYVKGDAHNFKIFVNTDRQEENAFYLHAVAFAQQGWSYNSENAWLPMPTDRTVRARSDGKPLFGSWKSLIRIIAYR